MFPVLAPDPRGRADEVAPDPAAELLCHEAVVAVVLYRPPHAAAGEDKDAAYFGGTHGVPRLVDVTSDPVHALDRVPAPPHQVAVVAMDFAIDPQVQRVILGIGRCLPVGFY